MELQLCSDLFFSLGSFNGIQHQIYVLLCAGSVGNNAVVIKVTNDGQIEKALSGSDVRNICYPLLVRSLGCKVAIEQIRIAMKIFSVLYIPFSPDNRQ